MKIKELKHEHTFEIDTMIDDPNHIFVCVKCGMVKTDSES